MGQVLQVLLCRPAPSSRGGSHQRLVKKPFLAKRCRQGEVVSWLLLPPQAQTVQPGKQDWLYLVSKAKALPCRAAWEPEARTPLRLGIVVLQFRALRELLGLGAGRRLPGAVASQGVPQPMQEPGGHGTPGGARDAGSRAGAGQQP